MTEPSKIRGAQTFLDDVVFAGGLFLPPDCVDQENIKTGAQVPADNLWHRHAAAYQQANGVDVVTATAMLHLAVHDGEIIDFLVRPGVLPAGGDKTVTIDVEKADNGSATWASILFAPLQFAAADVANTIKMATLAGPVTYLAGDAFRIVITAAGTTGTQLKGMVARLSVDEQPI